MPLGRSLPFLHRHPEDPPTPSLGQGLAACTPGRRGAHSLLPGVLKPECLEKETGTASVKEQNALLDYSKLCQIIFFSPKLFTYIKLQLVKH